MKKSSNGNVDQIIQVIENYHPKIFKYCFHMLRHQQEAEDATQEVFIKAYKNINELSDVHFIISWLYRIAYHHCLNVLKRKRLLQFISFQKEIHSNEHSCMMENANLSLSIDEILNSLSPKDRTVIILRVIEDKTYDEISDILHMSPSSVRKRYERARQRIKTKYSSNERSSGDESITVF